jgi:hypothetical protein
MKIAWLEHKYFEQTQQRHAKFRVALARSPDLHGLMSLNYWANRAGALETVWDEVLNTLVLGVCAGPGGWSGSELADGCAGG